jgi:hypothetical protein
MGSSGQGVLGTVRVTDFSSGTGKIPHDSGHFPTYLSASLLISRFLRVAFSISLHVATPAFHSAQHSGFESVT